MRQKVLAMMEFEKMRNGEFYDFTSEECLASYYRAINYNGTMLDGGLISIGANTQVGPNCQFLTPNHPFDPVERRKPVERCSPISIGEDCWLGGGVTVCPGVSIGDRCIIGAGSVVVKDIPSDSLAVGNPCKVIRKL